jgi:hypothetical protein
MRHVWADRFHPGTTDTTAGKENGGRMNKSDVECI